MSEVSKPHKDRRAEAWSRIDTTKTEDMVPSSELRGWLVEYVSLFEQLEAQEGALKMMVMAADLILAQQPTPVSGDSNAMVVDIKAGLYALGRAVKPARALLASNPASEPERPRPRFPLFSSGESNTESESA
jgi:hypothetical protein